MSINDLINDLVKELQPVRPIRPAGFRMAAWTAVSIAAVAALLLAIPTRRDIDAVLGSRRLAVDFFTVLLLAVTAAWGALKLSVPGEEKPVLHRYAPAALLGFWCLVTAINVALDAAHTGIEAVIPDTHVVCALLVAGVGGLLTLPIGILIRGAAPMDPRWCGALAGIAAGAAAMMGIELLCVYDRAAHFAVYHVLPVALFAAAGALLGPRFLKPAAR